MMSVQRRRRGAVAVFYVVLSFLTLAVVDSLVVRPLPNERITYDALAGSRGGTIGHCRHAPPRSSSSWSQSLQHDERLLSSSRQQQPTSSSSSSSSSLQASPLLSAITSPLGAFTVLTAIVLVHESGHYLAARVFGIDVDEFSIGFGPKLAGFNALGNEFNFRLLPLGGYVRFPENYNATLVEEQQKEAFQAERERRKRSEAELGGSGMVLLNAVTFGAVERRQRLRQQNELILRENEELRNRPWWKKIGPQKPKEIVSAEGLDNGTDNDEDEDDIEIEYYDDPNLLQNRPWQQRAVVLSAGVVFNLLLSFSLYFGEIRCSPNGLAHPTFEPGAVVSVAPRRDAAANGVLNRGDIIVGVDGEPIGAMNEQQHAHPTAFEAQRSVGDFITKIRETRDGESLSLSVLKANNNIAGSNKPVDVTITPKRTDPSGPQTIGAVLSPNYGEPAVLKSDSAPEAAGMAARYLAEVTRDTAQGLSSAIATMFTGMFSGKSSSSSSGGGSQVSGPIGLIKTGSELVSTRDLGTVLLFASAISINLGVVNAFPLPALDGGQLMFVLAEAITGRKVNQRLQEGISGVAVILLLAASLGAAVGDIESFFIR